MAYLLNIQSSPRGAKSASIVVADAFITAYLAEQPETELDRLNVFEEQLREYGAEAIEAKYKGAADKQMDGAEAALWRKIQALADRFEKADRTILGLPMGTSLIHTS